MKAIKWDHERVHLKSLRQYLGLAIFLGWQDVRDTYQRSTLGPLWMTMALGLQVLAIGSVFVLLLGADPTDFFPYLAVSLTVWSFILSSLNDSTGAYIQSRHIVKQVYVPSFLPVVRVFAKNAIIFAHNLTILVLVFLVTGIPPSISVLAFVPGFAVLASFLYAVSSVFATISVRYQDLPPMVSSFLMLSFYVTPIIWMPGSLPEPFREIVLVWNPLYHLMELVRLPLLGELPSGLNWSVSVAISLVFGLLAWGVAKKYSWRVAYWL